MYFWILEILCKDYRYCINIINIVFYIRTIHILLTAQIFLPDYLYFLRYWSRCVLQLFLHHVVTLEHQVVFLYDQNVKTKLSISWRQKQLLRWNKKHFSSFLKSYHLPKLVSDLRVRLWHYFKTFKPFQKNEVFQFLGLMRKKFVPENFIW